MDQKFRDSKLRLLEFGVVGATLVIGIVLLAAGLQMRAVPIVDSSVIAAVIGVIAYLRLVRIHDSIRTIAQSSDVHN